MPARFQYPVKRSPKSDPQQYRLYRMENEAIGARGYHTLTRPLIHALARSVCKNYRVPMVALKWKNLKRTVAQWISPGVIELSTKKLIANDMLTVTHELAHHVHHWLSKGADKTQQNHGPEFMAVHMSILDTCRVIPVVGMRAICATWKISFYDPGTGCSLDRLRRICRKIP